jgi:hypothetical protein
MAPRSTLRRAIAEVRQRWSGIGWVTKNLLSRAPPCFGRHVKLLVPVAFASTPVSRRVRHAADRKNKCRIFITTWWKHVVPTQLSGIRVGRRSWGVLWSPHYAIVFLEMSSLARSTVAHLQFDISANAPKIRAVQTPESIDWCAVDCTLCQLQ